MRTREHNRYNSTDYPYGEVEGLFAKFSSFDADHEPRVKACYPTKYANQLISQFRNVLTGIKPCNHAECTLYIQHAVCVT